MKKTLIAIAITTQALIAGCSGDGSTADDEVAMGLDGKADESAAAPAPSEDIPPAPRVCSIDVQASGPHGGRHEVYVGDPADANVTATLYHSFPNSDIIGDAGKHDLACTSPPNPSIEAYGYAYEMHWNCVGSSPTTASYLVRIYTQTELSTGVATRRAELRIVDGGITSSLGTGACTF